MVKNIKYSRVESVSWTLSEGELERAAVEWLRHAHKEELHESRLSFEWGEPYDTDHGDVMLTVTQRFESPVIGKTLNPKA